ncbi:hypothetical protein BC827DRAFT_1164885 [Russula dissimulans]|nr:hypothetical protein BC827DRAFT_1164885 [Russula dissimulans]
MLAITTLRGTRPSPSPSPLDMQPRGRSRDVSPVALARQASEERRRSRTSIMSCYPLPSDSEKHTFSHFYLSPPSLSSTPSTSPLTLTPPDPAPLRAHPRIRVLYQDTSHAPIDPHQSAFTTQLINPQPLPFPVQSRLSSPPVSSPLVEKPALQVAAGQRAREQARAKRRYETLARAEQVFATILERSRRERLAALLMRAQQEDELKERERVTREFEMLERERERCPRVNHISHVQRSGFRVLARASPPASTSHQRQGPERFTYMFPIPSATLVNPASTRQRQGSTKTRLGLTALTGPNAANTRSVSFDDIRASMGNVLFPIAHGESALGMTRRGSELLATLLDPVRWEEGERWLPGGRVNAWTSHVPETVPECEACASVSLSLDGTHSPRTPPFSSDISASTSTSTSVTSRPISWLSFGSRKSIFSIDTVQTDPPSTINCTASTSGRLSPQHSCGGPRGQSFVSVDVNDSPLGAGAGPLSAPVYSAANVNILQEPTRQRMRRTSFSVRTWLTVQSSVTSVLSAAARFQHVYVTATTAALTAANHTQNAPTLTPLSSETFLGQARCPPRGSRARRSDVVKFTQMAPHAEGDAVPYLVFHLVELESNHRSPNPTPESPRTATPPSITIHPTYHDTDRHIFNSNPLHLLSRAQINSWRSRGTPGAMPARVICRPELFYRIEPAGSPLREAKGGSALKWGWRVVWDTDDHVEY